MNQWEIVWLPVWINLDLILEVVLYLARVSQGVHKIWRLSLMGAKTSVKDILIGEKEK